jgi:ABC-2 type transport system permease protein
MKNDFVLISRGLLKLVRRPSEPLTGLGMSLFFLAVYQAGFGGIGFLPEFGGAGYLAFILPMSLVSLSMGSSAGAGPSLHDDLQSGYFRRLYLSTVPRWTFVAAPILADALATMVLSAALLGAGVLFGVPLRFGLVSAFLITVLSLLWGVTLSGLSAGIMLRTGNPQGARIVTTAVFPLIFLSTTFLPRELITSRWLKAVSWGNPLTYLMEGMRYLMAGTAPGWYLTAALVLAGTGALAALLFALSGCRKILV